jgi:hypothetical protein
MACLPSENWLVFQAAIAGCCNDLIYTQQVQVKRLGDYGANALQAVIQGQDA